MRIPLCLLVATAPFAVAQEPQTLAVEGLDLPGLPGNLVIGLDSPTANAAGGFAIPIGLDDGVATYDVVWGSTDGAGAPSVLVTQGPLLGFTQGGFEFICGVSSSGTGFVSYSTGLEPGGLDSVWSNDFPVAIEGDPIPTLPGKVYRFASRPGFTESAEPTFIGGIDDASGASGGNGLFKGFIPVALLKSNDVVPGLPLPLSIGSAIDFDYRFSPDGTRHLVPVDMEGAAPTEDFALVHTGAGLTIGGALVRELTLLPAAQQVDPAEAWDNFDFMGITDDGSYMFTGDTDGPTDTDEFVVIDGVIVLREGDVVGGETLTGSIEGASYSSAKDLSVTWDVVDGISDVEALLFNGRVVLREGQEVDTDLDGIVNAGHVISGFVGISSNALAGDRSIYVTVDVDTLGTTSTSDDIEVLLCIPIASLVASTDTVSVSAGGTVDFTLFTERDVPVDLFFLLGSASGSAPGLPIDSFVLPLNLDPYFNFTISEANSAILQNTFAAPDALGVGDASLVVPAATDPVLAGTTLTHAYLTLDVGGAVAVSSVSNAVDVTLVP